MILLRTARIDSQVLSFGDELRSASGLNLALVVDERFQTADQCRFPKISLNPISLASLKLHLPADVGWRCGDYGFYLAASRYSDINQFWMFEFDVRIRGDARDFFQMCAAHSDVDLLAPKLKRAEKTWWWWSYIVSADAAPFSCFFPVIRLSRRAIDLLYAKRKAHSRKLNRVALWPNDEGFVATTIANSQFTWADLNDLGEELYRDATFSHDIPEEDYVPCDGPPQLIHPIRSGPRGPLRSASAGSLQHWPEDRLDRYRQKEALGFLIRRAIARRVNRLSNW
jgi:hypothetical protein